MWPVTGVFMALGLVAGAGDAVLPAFQLCRGCWHGVRNGRLQRHEASSQQAPPLESSTHGKSIESMDVQRWRDLHVACGVSSRRLFIYASLVVLVIRLQAASNRVAVHLNRCLTEGRTLRE